MLKTGDSRRQVSVESVLRSDQVYFDSVSGSFLESHDLPLTMIQEIARAEALVESIRKSDGKAFLLERSTRGMTLHKNGSVGDVFYAWAEVRGTKKVPGYEVSSAFRLLRHAAKEFGLNSIQLSGDPERIIGEDSYREGELINAVTAHVKALLQSKAYKDGALRRKRNTANIVAKESRYIRSIVQRYPHAFTIRADLVVDACRGNQLSIEIAHGHVESFLEALQVKPCYSAIVGYFWQCEFLSEIGYRHHFGFFVDEQRVSCHQAWPDIMGLWSSVTLNKGMCLRWSGDAQSYGARGSGPLYILLNELLEDRKIMLNRDALLLLKTDRPNQRNGMGKLPLIDLRCANLAPYQLSTLV